MATICQTKFKRRESFKDVLCCRDYSERVVSIFTHQIQSEYYGENISVYIDVIALEHFSALHKSGINAPTKSRSRHAVFHSFFSDYRKHDSATTTEQSKNLIGLLKERKLLTS